MSPGPALYASLDARSDCGKGSSVRIGTSKRFARNQPGSMVAENGTDAGPGHYRTNTVQHLKAMPRATFGNTKRKLGL